MTGASKAQALAVGHRLGQYEIIDVLAVDAVGIEYAALDRDVGKPVTVGEYFPQGLASRQQGGQVRSESATAFDLGLRGFLARARSRRSIIPISSTAWDMTMPWTCSAYTESAGCSAPC